MSFSTRRGRPRAERAKRDTGTPELAAKRAAGLTTETLDLCLERNLITPQQHWCGVHLRWLYTLRFGAPGVRALDARHMGGMDIRTEDPSWREAREVEYQCALSRLNPHSASLLLSLCVFNERPLWLSAPAAMSKAAAQRNDAALSQLQKGFEALECLWCRKRISKHRHIE